MLRRGCSGDDKDSSANDSANPKGNQVAGTQGTLQTVFTGLVRFVKDGLNRLGR
jgi:hypothetical protein